MERSLVILKPDAIQRRLIGSILARFEAKGLKIVALRLCRLTNQQTDNLYSVHKGKKFFEPLVRFMQSGPVAVMALEGPRAVAVTRKLLGETFGFEASPGTIRGDFGLSRGYNLVHGSDSVESATRELAVFFKEADYLAYELSEAPWAFNPAEDLN
ncbi:MAG: nucleoside-diphosphate kinase [Planctomycetota bacterium]|nr:nucleoside-diphosphate kinase [Planctomycetota bacterium]